MTYVVLDVTCWIQGKTGTDRGAHTNQIACGSQNTKCYVKGNGTDAAYLLHHRLLMYANGKELECRQGNGGMGIRRYGKGFKILDSKALISNCKTL